MSDTRVIVRGSIAGEVVDYAWTDCNGVVSTPYQPARGLRYVLDEVKASGYADAVVRVEPEGKHADGVVDYTIEAVDNRETTCTDCASVDETHTYACQMNWSSARDTQLDELVESITDIVAEYRAGRIDDRTLAVSIEQIAATSVAMDIEFAEVCDWLDVEVGETVDRILAARTGV